MVLWIGNDETGACSLTCVDGTATVDPNRAHEAFNEDSDPALVATISRRLRPPPSKGELVVTVVPTSKAIPPTYVLCLRDRAISPALPTSTGRPI